MPGCKVVSAGKPNIWKDDDGWRCEQAVQCLTCDVVWSKDLAEDVAWLEALAAAAERALP